MKYIAPKTKKTKNPTATMSITLAVLLVIIGGLVFLMIRNIQASLYSERKSLLTQLTESSALVVNEEIEHVQYITDMMTDNAQVVLPGYENLSAFFDDLGGRESHRSILFFVDDSGKYYSSDGVRGKMTDMTYYTDSTDDKLYYISSLPHLQNTATYLVFRNRLSSPLTVNVGDAEATLTYAGLLYDIEQLNTTVSDKFSGDNNTFIYDTASGVMLYRYFGIRLLLDGYNIYPKFEQSVIPFGENPEELILTCQRGETLVVALNIDGEVFYFCSAPIESVNWSVAFIVQSAYMDDLSGNAFNGVIAYVSIIAFLLGAAIVFIAYTHRRNISIKENLAVTNELNRELEQASRAKSDFLSNMSHDIRTPINGIMGMTVIAKNVPGNPEKTVDCLNKIDISSRHLLSLVNDVLDMSRIERGKLEIARAPIDIRTVMDNCMSIIRGQASDRQLTILSETDCTHPRIIGDDLHLRQIFINILGNAVKFTKDGGSIWFRCRETACDGDTVTLTFEVEDTGIGMRPEFIGKVFEVFSQDEGGARSSYKGTGLGMPITKQLTELMGGTISVESELNKGSTFTVTVPFIIDDTVEEAPVTAARDTAPSAQADIRGVKLLLAEDNEMNMEIATELLTDAGAVITGVENGKLALEAFANNPAGTFDAILMDMMMPVMDGLEATRAIRALPREDAQTIPILAMTANAFDSDVRATREAGMDAHLVKPINIDEVVETVARFTKYPPRRGCNRLK